MRRVETRFTCDRCGQQTTENGAREHPPFDWSPSNLDVIDAEGIPSIEKPLLCKSCRISLNVWLLEGDS